MIVISASEPIKTAKMTWCQNRLELLVDPYMSSETISAWAHEAVNNWLLSRVDSKYPRGYDSAQRGDHET